MATMVALFLTTPKPNNHLIPPKLRHVTTHSSSNPQTDCPVPIEQQPVNEYKSLSESFPFSWAAGSAPELEPRLFLSGAAFSLLVGFPVAWLGSHGTADPVRPVLGAVSSGLIFVTVAVVRMYLGWAYVGNRLLSATVEFGMWIKDHSSLSLDPDEETGWYDGQVWVKNAEVLARDRLLGSFSVKPVLSRLKNTLVVLSASLFVCAVMLINLEGNQKDSYKFSNEAEGRAVPGVYNDESARSFEPDAFCGEPGLQ